jgi:PadR family transcriptional regulator AphA
VTCPHRARCLLLSFEPTVSSDVNGLNRTVSRSVVRTISTVRLSPTSYVVPGMIALRGPSTSYDLKRAVSHSVGYFWQFPHAQLYDETVRLANAGLLDLESEDSGRPRKVYSITLAGLAELRTWLGEPAGQAFELRSIAELKLFFSELGSSGDVTDLAAEQVELHTRRLAEYEQMRARFTDRPRAADDPAPTRSGLGTHGVEVLARSARGSLERGSPRPLVDLDTRDRPVPPHGQREEISRSQQVVAVEGNRNARARSTKI